MTPTKRTPEEILASIEGPTTLDEEIDSVLAMTAEQRRAALEAHGVNLREVHAQADAFAATLGQPPEAEPAVVRRASRPPVAPRRRLQLLLAAVISVATGGGGVVAYLGTQAPVVGRGDSEAGALRADALAACDAQAWQRCLDGLDRARALDEKGDSAPGVQTARRAALAALGGGGGRTPR